MSDEERKKISNEVKALCLAIENHETPSVQTAFADAARAIRTSIER